MNVEALLHRPERVIDLAIARPLIAGRRVLITGAGGSIGSELARQVAKLEPAHLTLLNHSELALYEIDAELRGVPHDCAMVDVRDAGPLFDVFEERQPDVVFHAAAAKHVPMCEQNPAAAVTTNVGGTRRVLSAARTYGGCQVVVISTDKAVRPSCVMGATKRVAERIASFARVPCSVVRFGNVLGSSGSVLPMFERQLATTGVLTVTHPDVERYFMTVREAVGLVLCAATRGAGLYVLEMGKPVNIHDLAVRVVRESIRAGTNPAWRIEFTGLRPGEKLTEEMFHPDEAPRPFAGLPGVLWAEHRAEPEPDEFHMAASALENFASSNRVPQMLKTLRELAN